MLVSVFRCFWISRGFGFFWRGVCCKGKSPPQTTLNQPVPRISERSPSFDDVIPLLECLKLKHFRQNPPAPPSPTTLLPQEPSCVPSAPRAYTSCGRVDLPESREPPVRDNRLLKCRGDDRGETMLFCGAVTKGFFRPVPGRDSREAIPQFASILHPEGRPSAEATVKSQRTRHCHHV